MHLHAVSSSLKENAQKKTFMTENVTLSKKQQQSYRYVIILPEFLRFLCLTIRSLFSLTFCISKSTPLHYHVHSLSAVFLIFRHLHSRPK
jgi:hypothetical protein